jgi:hypothetical protein
LDVVNWKTKAQEWDGWRKFLEQAKPRPTKGCSDDNDNNLHYTVTEQCPFSLSLHLSVFLSPKLPSHLQF